MDNLHPLKKEADNLMRMKGRTKGSELLTLSSYIRQKYGEQKLKLLEREMERVGYPLKFDEIKPMEWYPESLNVLAMVVAEHLFGWKDLFEIGSFSPKFSIGVKLFMRFVSLERVFKEASKTWRRFLDFGTLKPYEFNEKEKYFILHLKDYKTHPDMCRYYAGFFLRITQYLKKSKKITAEETKCMFRGDPYHEYTIRWE